MKLDPATGQHIVSLTALRINSLARLDKRIEADIKGMRNHCIVVLRSAVAGDVTEAVVDKIQVVLDLVFELEVPVRQKVSSVKGCEVAECLINEEQCFIELVLEPGHKVVCLALAGK